MTQSEILERYTLGFPCHKYIVRNLETELDMLVFEREFAKLMTSCGFSHDTTEVSLVAMSTALTKGSRIFGKSFTIPGKNGLGEDFISGLLQDTSIPGYTKCCSFYRKYDSSVKACSICPLSTRYANANMELELSLVHYCLQSEAHYRKFLDAGGQATDFHSLMDMSESFQINRPNTIKLTNIVMSALSKEMIQKTQFPLSDTEFSSAVKAEVGKRMAKYKLPSFLMEKKTQMALMDIMLGKILLAPPLADENLVDAVKKLKDFRVGCVYSPVMPVDKKANSLPSGFVQPTILDLMQGELFQAPHGGDVGGSFLQSDSSEALLSDTRNPFDTEPSETEPLETKPPVENRKDVETKEEETLEETEAMTDETSNESLGQEAVFADGVPSVSMEQDFSVPYEAYEVSCVPNDDISSNEFSSNEFSMDAPDEIPDDVLYDDAVNVEPEDESIPEIAKNLDETSAESLDIPLQGDRDEVTVSEANTLSGDGEASCPAPEEPQETEGDSSKEGTKDTFQDNSLSDDFLPQIVSEPVSSAPPTEAEEKPVSYELSVLPARKMTKLSRKNPRLLSQLETSVAKDGYVSLTAATVGKGIALVIWSPTLQKPYYLDFTDTMATEIVATFLSSARILKLTHDSTYLFYLAKEHDFKVTNLVDLGVLAFLRGYSCTKTQYDFYPDVPFRDKEKYADIDLLSVLPAFFTFYRKNGITQQEQVAMRDILALKEAVGFSCGNQLFGQVPYITRTGPATFSFDDVDYDCALPGKIFVYEFPSHPYFAQKFLTELVEKDRFRKCPIQLLKVSKGRVYFYATEEVVDYILTFSDSLIYELRLELGIEDLCVKVGFVTV